MVGGTLGHQLRRTKTRRLQDAVSDGAETEKILRAVRLEGLPGVVVPPH
ncbi:MAG: hypothetical protein ACRELF_19565 [Gemmataceae bacterium]